MAFDLNLIEDETLRTQVQDAIDEASNKDGYFSQTEYDKKVNELSQKLHADRRQLEKEIRAEIEKSNSMSEAEKQAELERGYNEKLAALNIRENRIKAKDLFADTELDSKDVEKALEFLVTDDADTTLSRTKDYIKSVNDIKNHIVEDMKNKTPNPTPPTNETKTKADFDKMSYTEKLKFKTENPEAFNSFLGN